MKRSTDDVRDETSNLVREKRLKRITMTDDEKDLWFLFRNGQLRLGYSIGWKWQGRRRERNSNKCCMCNADFDKWSHVLICPVRLSWVKEWIREAKLRPFDTDYDLRQATTLEARTMTVLHMEVLSKMWCAWYDMWKAWRKRKVRSRRQMKELWKKRWCKRLKKTMYIDRRTNEKKARKKWNNLIIDKGPSQPGVDWELVINTRVNEDAVYDQNISQSCEE